MSVSRGDVVLVPYPQAPGQPPKRRPALVVQSDGNNARLSNSIFAMITTNTSLAVREAAQVLIDLSTPDGQASGLARTSAVKCENLVAAEIQTQWRCVRVRFSASWPYLDFYRHNRRSEVKDQRSEVGKTTKFSRPLTSDLRPPTSDRPAQDFMELPV
jgi:mRNA-degrading endonuclease toxin of MazEF toxin-antitoxin module